MTQPTRSQIDAMTREQAKTWAANNCRDYQLSCQCTACLAARLETRIDQSTPSPLVGADGGTTQGETQ